MDKNQIRKLYFEIGDKAVYDFAVINNVEPIVAHALKLCVSKNKLPKRWNFKYKETENKLVSYIKELNKIANILDKNNISLLALKNTGIAMGMYPYYGACPMGDIDVLVKKKQFQKAHRILIKNGYKLKFRSKLEKDDIDAAEQVGGAEYIVKLDNGEKLWFELQWRPVSGRWIQPKQEPDACELFHRSTQIKRSKVRLLSPEDNLLQVALHTAKHTYVRAPGFRLHTDVDRIVTSQNINWLVFEDKVLKLKIKTAVYISLLMARNLLGTNIPDNTLMKIQPNKLKVKIMLKWLKKVGVFYPNSNKWNKIGYIFFVSLLYDTWKDFFSGVFPASTEMKSQFSYSNSLLTPYYHLKRLINIMFRRNEV